MLYDGPRGKTLVPPEFNQLCIDNQVEVTVQAFSNPGNPYRAMRKLSFHNFSDNVIVVRQFNAKNQSHNIPARGTLEILLMNDEPLPMIEKVEDGNR